MVAVEAAAKKEIMIIMLIMVELIMVVLIMVELIIKMVVGFFGLEASKNLAALSYNRIIWLRCM